MTRQTPANLSRRNLLLGVGFAGLAAILWKTGGGLLRFMTPPLTQSPVEPVAAGRPEDFAPHSFTFIPAATAWLGRDTEGYFAVSAVCPHLGCTIARQGDGFECPCHGSRFNNRGEVVNGPATTSLTFFEVKPDEDGQLIIWPQTHLPATTRYAVEHPQEANNPPLTDE